MFAPALPILYPIAVLNLTSIYWLDKLQVLRFNRIPKNFDEALIIKLLDYAKLTFPIHFVSGCLLLSNDKILSSHHVKEEEGIVYDINVWSKDVFGHKVLTDQFYSKHLVLFITVNFTFLALLFFEQSIKMVGVKYFKKCCKFCMNL